MAFQLFTDLFNKVDQATYQYVSEATASSISTVAPIVSIALTLSFIAFGYLILKGAIEMPITEFLTRSFRIAVITNIALAGGLYQTEIAEIVRTLPDTLSTSLLPKHYGSETAAGLIDNAMETSLDLAMKAFKKAWSLRVASIGFALVGIVICLFSAALIGVGFAIFVTIKVAIAILAALGPFFILSLLWPPTVRFFELWTGQIMNYVLLMVSYSMVFGFIMNIYGGFMAAIDIEGAANIAYSVGGCVTLSIGMGILLYQLPSFASSLAGGIGLAFGEAARNLKRGTGAGMIGRGAKAGFSKLLGKKK